MLFFELHLPPNGDLNGPKSKKTLGYTRRGGGRVRLGKQFSTTKVMRANGPFVPTLPRIGGPPNCLIGVGRMFSRSCARCTRCRV